jgi:hypothetical protein
MDGMCDLEETDDGLEGVPTMPRIPEGLALSVAIWTGVGAALGIAMGNMWLWIPAGIVIGVTLWVVRKKPR